MFCSNKECPVVEKLLHRTCFEELENGLLKILQAKGSARRWTEEQRLNNLWTKKGMTLLGRYLRCRCSKGLLDKRQDFRMVSPGAGSESVRSLARTCRDRRGADSNGRLRSCAGPQEARQGLAVAEHPNAQPDAAAQPALFVSPGLPPPEPASASATDTHSTSWRTTATTK